MCVEVCVIRMSLLLVIYDQVYFRKLNTTTLESIDLEMCLKENNSFNELCFFFSWKSSKLFRLSRPNKYAGIKQEICMKLHNIHITEGGKLVYPAKTAMLPCLHVFL